MEGFENGDDMSTSKRVLNLLEPVKLTVWKVMIERVTVVKFRVNYRGGKSRYGRIQRSSRMCSDLIREGKVFIKK